MAMCVMIPGMVGSVTDMAIPHALADALDSTRNPNNKKVSYLTRITLDGFLRGTGFMARIADHEVARLKAEVSLVRLVERSEEQTDELQSLMSNPDAVFC